MSENTNTVQHAVENHAKLLLDAALSADSSVKAVIPGNMLGGRGKDNTIVVIYNDGTRASIKLVVTLAE